MKKDTSNEWHWLTGGLVVSALSIFTYFVFAAIAGRNYPFGITAGFGYVAGLFGKLFPALADNPVIKRFAEKPDAFIELFILAGLVIGGYAASKRSGSRDPENIPAVWQKYHGRNAFKRYVFVFVGSVLLGYGAALSGGCTTGNILQGWAHLSLGSIVAGASFFAAGIVAARLLYPRLRGGHDGD